MLTSAQVQELVERMLKSSAAGGSTCQPAVRRRDAARGPPAARRAGGHQPWLLRGEHPQVRARAARLHDLVELGSLTPQAAAFLEASVRAGLNILVAGGTQAGKTTMLNCLAAAIPGGERVVSRRGGLRATEHE